MNYFKNSVKGFTLIEMLLVLVIISAIILALVGYTQQKAESMRRDRTAMQMQQIENASLSYYVSTSSWPTNIAALKTAGYLPGSINNNPYGNAYYINSNSTTGTFAVCTAIVSNNNINAMTLAQTIAGMLPAGMVVDTANPSASCSPTMTQATSCSNPSCSIVSVVNIPGQNLNNARSVNFTGIYKTGACVPVPKCPGTNMTPSITVVPTSVSGVYQSNTVVVPISSFIARTTAPAMTPTSCADNNPPAQACDPATTTGTGPYWRVCLQVWTQEGEITSSSNSQGWGQMTGLAAFTRCVPNNEPQGSNFSVYTND